MAASANHESIQKRLRAVLPDLAARHEASGCPNCAEDPQPFLAAVQALSQAPGGAGRQDG